MKNFTARPAADPAVWHNGQSNGAAIPERSGFTGPAQTGVESGLETGEESEWARRFEELLNTGDTGSGDSPSREMPALFPGGGVPAGTNMPPRAGPENRPGAGKRLIQAVAERIAETCSASDPRGPDHPRIRFFIRNPGLRGTEVRIVEQNGRLCLTLIPSRPDVRRLLSTHRADLSHRLKCRTGKETRITII